MRAREPDNNNIGSFFYLGFTLHLAPCTWLLSGELFVKKQHVSYSLQENESRDLLDAESWIQLGDHAHLDSEGFVVLEGLKKVSNYTQNGQSFLDVLEGLTWSIMPCCPTVE